ncbi:hypothetical protein SAMN05444395_11521 [Flavobacterium fryxellicola]|nr:hypothetical protein SAMN05444395_11521 [Flavobacterium fryxellicola]
MKCGKLKFDSNTDDDLYELSIVIKIKSPYEKNSPSFKY